MRTIRDSTPTYPPVSLPSVQLKPRKNHPKQKFSARVSQSGLSVFGFSRIAARAGLRVSELKAEMSVETAIVRANWR